MRVAALLPAATDIVIALGAGDQLVAVTHACTLPSRLTEIPRVTRSRVTATGASGIDTQVSDLSSAGAPLFELDEALLSAQRPDVVLTQSVCDLYRPHGEWQRRIRAGLGEIEHLMDDADVIGVMLDHVSPPAALRPAPQNSGSSPALPVPR